MARVLQAPEELNLVKAYLRGEGGPSEEYWKEIGDEKVKAVLNHLRMTFVQVLPQVFEKKLFIDYGALSPEEYKALPEEMQKLIDPHVAFPWMGANAPDIGSRYHLSLAEAFYTLMHHRNQGVTLDLVQKEVIKLKAQALEALRKPPTLTVGEIEAYRAFQKLCGNDLKLNLFDLSDSDYVQIQRAINGNKDQLYDFIKIYIMPKIQVNRKIAIVGAQLLGILPNQLQGFTGTLASPEIFPGRSLAQPDPVSFWGDEACAGQAKT